MDYLWVESWTVLCTGLLKHPVLKTERLIRCCDVMITIFFVGEEKALFLVLPSESWKRIGIKSHIFEPLSSSVTKQISYKTTSSISEKNGRFLCTVNFLSFIYLISRLKPLIIQTLTIWFNRNHGLSMHGYKDNKTRKSELEASVQFL